MKKKLNLKALESSAKEILSREQLKKITGGDDGSCGFGEQLYTCTSPVYGTHYFCGTNPDTASTKYMAQVCYPLLCPRIHCTL